MRMEKSKPGAKERSPHGLSLPNQNTILIYIKCYSFTRNRKKKQWNSMNKKQMNLNNRKMTDHSPSPNFNICISILKCGKKKKKRKKEKRNVYWN